MKKSLYQILDLITLHRGIRRYISGFYIKFPARYYKYYKPDYELNNINFINNYLAKGMVAIDIGAHIGLLASIMAKKVGNTGKVYSFEPTPGTFDLLKKTIEVNGLKGIIFPFQRAVSDRKGTTTFYITDIEAHNSNSLSFNSRTIGNEKGIKVEMISVDGFVVENSIKRVDLIKIDAEGAELAVLKGCKTTILTHQPKIILGLHPSSIKNFGDSLEEIWDIVTQWGYAVYFNSEEITKDWFLNQNVLFDVFLMPKPKH